MFAPDLLGIIHYRAFGSSSEVYLISGGITYVAYTDLIIETPCYTAQQHHYWEIGFLTTEGMTA